MLEEVEGKLTSHPRQRDEERMQELSKSRKEILKALEWQLENMDEGEYSIIEMMKEIDKLNNEDQSS